ncbi:uncharacterized protein [Mytilus edulis]|uniref:uncharacterized protein n=1 Tax=Mytilus edulis TaxID=6550 RepID=UPI0039EE3C27
MDMDIRFPLRMIALLVTFHIAVCQDELRDRSGSDNETGNSSHLSVFWLGVALAAVFAVSMIIASVLVILRKIKNKNEILLLQRKLTEIEGHRLNIEIERLTIEKRRLEIVENKLAFSAA